MSEKPQKENGIDQERFFNEPGYRKTVQKVINFEKRVKLLAVFIIPLFATILGLMIYFSWANLPSLEELENPKPDLASVVYSDDGEVIHRFFMKNRRLVGDADISKFVPEALLANEDRRFYDHWGFDLVRFIKAVWVNVSTLSAAQGASTITQQLARTLYLNDQSTTLTRKIRELFTAIEIERTYTKSEILNMYLNIVYFGSGAHGIESAAQTFFGKNAKDLTVAEAATLIGVLPSPGRYSPVQNPDKSKERRNLIMFNMKEVGYITEAEYNEYKKLPIETKFTPVTDMGLAPYFTENVRQQMEKESQRYGFDLYRDGLNIYTTINAKMQRIANESAVEHMDSIQIYFDQDFVWDDETLNLMLSETTPYANAMLRKESSKAVLSRLKKNKAFVDSVKASKMTLQNAFVVIDPHTGYIKSWVGGRDFNTVKFDHVSQARRQPGSTFKPIIYTVAIDNGYAPTFELLNQPVAIEDVNSKGSWWTPKNSEGQFGGLTTLRDALRHSLNLITIRLVLDIAKPTQVVDYARRMGIKSPLSPYMSIALGSYEVTPLEMTSAIGTIANGGVHIEPIGIKEVDDKNGNQLFKYTPIQNEAFSKETAYIMTNMMQSVMDSGTGVAARSRYHFYGKAAGKTGTTNEQSDTWFIGFTPELLGGVWVGNDDRRIHFPDMTHGQGARAALPIWAKFMKKVYESREIGMKKDGEFVRPPGVISLPVCSKTKKVATEFCPTTYNEVFTKRSVPEQCDVHINADSKDEEQSKTRKKRDSF